MDFPHAIPLKPQLILKYLLYPEYFDDLILVMKNELRLPVDSPKSLYEGTMKRFENWHDRMVNWKGDSREG